MNAYKKNEMKEGKKGKKSKQNDRERRERIVGDIANTQSLVPLRVKIHGMYISLSLQYKGLIEVIFDRIFFFPSIT